MTGWAVGWRRIGPTPGLLAWSKAALPVAQAALAASDDPLRCGGTWAVGLDLLENDASGRVGGVDLPWDDLGLTPEALHKAQLSTVHPGYPQPSPEESPAAQTFRRSRDAAHVDGLLPVGPDRRRMIKEPHAWILGLALNEHDAGASPLVVWQGSHLIMGAAFRAALGDLQGDLDAVDLTEVYTAARRDVFRLCRRIEVPVRPGQATLLHRMTLHGVAPWADGATAPPEGRIIAYFRPLAQSVADWLAVDSA